MRKSTEVALVYHQRGWAIIPLRPRSKAPAFDDWQTQRYDTNALIDMASALYEQHGDDPNYGVNLGRLSRNLADVDLDHPAAIRLANMFLPPTSSVFGRASKRNSHWLYYASGDIRLPYKKYVNPLSQEVYLEIRSDGHQTMLPPSIHGESGERVEWHTDQEPSAVQPEDLVRACGLLASCCLFASYWGAGNRHVLAMHLAGGLLRARWTTEETEAFIQAICIAAGDLEVQDRLRCVRDTAEKLERGEETTGWPSLYEFLDERVVKAGRKWLDLQTDDRRYNFSDLGNARRMSAAVGQDIRYCYSWRKWLVWDRKRWCIDTSGAIMRFARDTIRGIYEEARNEHDPDKRQQLGKWALASESERRMASMIKLLQSEPGISVSPDELDQNMFLLNCQNGTLDLRTGGLREFRREDMLTKITNAAYDPAAPHPMLDQHLAVCHSDNEGVIHFLHKAFGYSLTGAMTEDCFFLNYGQGRNGKSTMLEAVQHVMGEYAAMAAPETFMAKNRDGGIPNDLAALHGARFVIAIETGEGKRMAESVIKQITGGDRITARYLFSEYFTYQPSFKLWIGTNHPPTIRSNNVGIWSRVRMIPWNARLDLLPIYDNTFRERLPYEEATGILAWLVRGCLLWQSEGLGTPPEIEQATSDYRIDQDVLAGFISECCASEGLIKTSVLYKAYVGWCQRTGEVPIRNVTFKQRMLERGIRQVIRDGYPTWLDISLAVDINSLQTVFSAGGNGHDNPFGRPQD